MPVWKKGFVSFFAFFIAFHAATLFHEFLGHGLAAKWLGGTIRDFHIHLMGASGYLHADVVFTGPGETLFFEWAGILVTALLAAALWRCRAFPVWIAVVCFFSSSLGYTVLGLHFRYGDPRYAAQFLESAGLRSATVGFAVLLHMFLLYRWAWRSGKISSPFLTLPGLAVGLSTGALAVAALNSIETTLRESATMEKVMASQAEINAWQQKRRELFERKAGRVTPEELEKTWRRARTAAAAEKPWPIQWVYYPLLAASLFAGLGHARRGESPSEPQAVPLKPYLLAALLSILISAVANVAGTM